MHSRKWVLLLLTSMLHAAPPLQERIDAVLESSEGAKHAFWGIQIASLKDAGTLYQRNGDRFFVPASNTKLFTTALALTRLGPDHRFHTMVVADETGDLRLVGGGDPTLTLRDIETFADSVVAAGIRRVNGDIVGDDTAYIWQPYGPGWGNDDPLWEYGAPVSALIVNDNSFALTVTPLLSLRPPFEYFTIDNRVDADPLAARHISVERAPGSRQLRISGNLPPGSTPASELLAIDDPALYAAAFFYDTLSRRGIAIHGRPVARHRLEPAETASSAGRPLAERTSPPLIEILRTTDKVSQNLYAELMLRAVGKGSLRAGLAEMQAFLSGAGVAPSEYSLHDGSGLSRLNVVTPAAVVKLLRFMYQSLNRDDWISLLPIGGEDGTLAGRFDKNPQARRIRAKTGTLTHVSALSGYLDPFSQNPRVFSIFVNNYEAPSDDPRTSTIDRICITALDKE